MIPRWKKYQEEVAAFFRSIGHQADTDVNIKGARSSHDVDVLILFKHIGFKVTWIIECKCWNKPVNKLHVLALREIVSDAGADRGIIIGESGFQSGAIEAAHLTNVQVTSLTDLSIQVSNDVFELTLRGLSEKISKCSALYYDIPKEKRIEVGLRQDINPQGYSGGSVILFCQDIFSLAFLDRFPIRPLNLGGALGVQIPDIIHDKKELITFLTPIVEEFEMKIKEVNS